jgi:hypothetical protein
LGAHWGYDSCIPCWCHWRHVRGLGEAGKLSLPGPLLGLRGPSRLITDTMRLKAGSRPCVSLHPCTTPAVLSLPPSLCLDKKKRGGKKMERVKEKKGNRKKYQGPEGAAPPFSLSHGGAGQDSFHHYAGPSAKTREAWVYVDRAWGLSGAEGHYVPCTCGRIYRVLYSFL